jgi:putative ABC transport system ATP-binding protein
MLELKNITKNYTSGKEITSAIKDASFTIHKGEFVAIMGPSGSGKSTLMHIIGCLDTPTLGQYHLDGQDVAKLSTSELAAIRRNKIGFVFQSFHLLPRATVLRNVTLPLVYLGVKREERLRRAKETLVAAGLDESHYEHLSNQLSGGQMQRVAIARALINNPAIILADEPTGNLDSKTGKLVLDTFERLHQQGRTIIIITHEPTVAARAERTILIRDGEIIEDQSNCKLNS